MCMVEWGGGREFRDNLHAFVAIMKEAAFHFLYLVTSPLTAVG